MLETFFMTKSHLPTCIQLHLHSIYLKKYGINLATVIQFRPTLLYTFQSFQTIVTKQGW